MEIYNLSAYELSQKLQSKELSTVEVIAALLKHTNKVDSEVQAYIEVYDILKQAKDIDYRRAKGENLGLFTGIPIAIKDNILIQDKKTTCSSKILDHFISPYSATVIERLQHAGLLIMGKVSLDEFAMGGTGQTAYRKKTKNPYDITRVAGGSSSGSAAVVASGQVPLSLGSDTGGSIRQPAALCGILGLKPTYGSISRYGLVPFSDAFDQIGSFAKTTRDITILSDILYGFDIKDATTRKGVGLNFDKNLSSNIQGLKIGIFMDEFEGISPSVVKAFDDTIIVLQKLGAAIIPLSMNYLRYALSVYYVLSSVDAFSNLSKLVGDNFEDALENRTVGFGIGVKSRLLTGAYCLSDGKEYCEQAQQMLGHIKNELNDLLSLCDVIATPTIDDIAKKIGTYASKKIVVSDLLSVAANLGGYPAISVPCGFDIMPIGIQFLGKHLSEQSLFNLSFALEQNTPYFNHGVFR